jgi:isoleucyl-tRNA synthetase
MGRIQSEEFQRLGVLGEWDNPYLTMSHHYEAATARELARFAERGGLFKGKKPVHWCSSCVTALAEAEVEYADHTSSSIYVKFPYVDELPAELSPCRGKSSPSSSGPPPPGRFPPTSASASIPTLPYVAVEVGEECWCWPRGSAPGDAGTGDCRLPVLATFEGKIFEGRNCRHPLYDRSSLLMLGDHVTLEAGTGCVHTAPGHGQDDYQIGLRYGLEVYNPVDNYGRYLETSNSSAARRSRGQPGSQRQARGSRRPAQAGKGLAQLPALLALQEADHLPRHRAVVHLHGGQRAA